LEPASGFISVDDVLIDTDDSFSLLSVVRDS
jgi:hypothetical protein